MEVGRTSSPSSIKNVSNLSAFIKKRSHEEKGTRADDENSRLNQPLPCKVKSKSTDRWFPMPGRDLRLDRPPKLTKYRTFHGSPSISKKQMTKSRSMGTECLSRMTPLAADAPRPELQKGSGSRNMGHETQPMATEDLSKTTHVTEKAPRPEIKKDAVSTSVHRTCFIAVLLISAIPLLACSLFFYFQSTGNPGSCPEAPDRAGHFDFHQLKAELDDRVFGQASAIAAILHALNIYFSADLTAERPLVLSLHGGMGVGKTLVARVLERHFVGRKANVHWYFPDSEALDDWVLRRMAACSTNVFMLDDVDQDNRVILLQIKKLLTAWSTNPVVQHMRVVFVVTTNASYKRINEFVVSELRRGRQRHDILLSHFLAPEEFLDIPNLKFVPFLPLDKSVVILCAKRFLELYNYYGKNYSDDLLDDLMSEDRFFPEDFPVLSKSGCKKVHVGL